VAEEVAVEVEMEEGQIVKIGKRDKVGR